MTVACPMEGGDEVPLANAIRRPSGLNLATHVYPHSQFTGAGGTAAVRSHTRTMPSASTEHEPMRLREESQPGARPPSAAASEPTVSA